MHAKMISSSSLVKEAPALSLSLSPSSLSLSLLSLSLSLSLSLLSLSLSLNLPPSLSLSLLLQCLSHFSSFTSESRPSWQQEDLLWLSSAAHICHFYCTHSLTHIHTRYSTYLPVIETFFSMRSVYKVLHTHGEFVCNKAYVLLSFLHIYSLAHQFPFWMLIGQLCFQLQDSFNLIDFIWNVIKQCFNYHLFAIICIK